MQEGLGAQRLGMPSFVRFSKVFGQRLLLRVGHVAWVYERILLLIWGLRKAITTHPFFSMCCGLVRHVFQESNREDPLAEQQPWLLITNQMSRRMVPALKINEMAAVNLGNLIFFSCA